jgi:uncharacterized membrane protein YedE/YeeE
MPAASHAFVSAFAGGVLIGLASLLVLLATGKIAGISGMLSRLLRPRQGDTAWRLVFLVGLVAGAALAFSWVESAAVFRPVRSLAAVGVAGLLVGFGTRLSGGCTSGHGVCGIGLGSKASLVATMVFMIAGMATVFVLRHFQWGPAP